jgi:putative ABC transport system permease protein
MFKNYLLIAWRNLKKNKFFTFINIFGLAVGLTCCMLIALYLHYEFSFDKHYKNGDRTVLVGTTFKHGAKSERTPNTPAPLGPALQKEYPEIEKIARVMSLFADDKTLIQYKEDSKALQSFYESNGFMADSTYFQIFDYSFSEGNPTLALNEPNTIVISEEMAQSIFGKEPALNKVLHINSSTNDVGDYKVTGVFRKSQQPSTLGGEFFLSLSSGEFGDFVRRTTNFANNNMFNTYLLLKPGTGYTELEKKLPAFVEKYMSADIKQAGGNKQQFLLPMKDLHLRSNFSSFGPVGRSFGNLSYLYVLGSIAVFILIIACINFMNLATARSAKRASEVGVRKVLGAEKSALIRQFLGESLLLAFISFIVAIGLMIMLLPVFSSVSGAKLFIRFSEQYLLFGGFVILAVVAGFLAGSYPAFYLSAFKPIKVLKGKFSNSLSAVALRKSLVVFQFTISAGLIICALVIGKQLNFMRTTDLGFIKDQQVVIPLRSDNSKDVYASLKAEIARNPQIRSTGASFYYPGIFNPSDMNFYRAGKTIADAINIKMNYVDNSFLQTLGVKPLAGRLFSPEFPADTNYRMVVNEATIRKFGFKNPEEAVNQEIVFDWQGTSYRFTLIGIVKDFNHEGLQKPIEPFAFQLNNRPFFNYIVAHVQAGNMNSLLASLEQTWKKLNPNEPFEYSFLDQDFQKNYEAENRLASLIKYFMIIAITICCLGLFGLAAFSAEQRTREIGIRKVLGSSVTGIIGLLSKDFIKLVLIGNVIAIPLAWYIMHKWLQEFAFQTSLDWWLFGVALLLSVLIALFTVSYQSIRSALSNPIESLRTE